MKTRETKKQQKTDVILSEATDGINKVRLMGTARAEEGEEECPWEEIDAYSGRFVVAGFRYENDDASENFHPWIAYSTDGGETWTRSETTSEEDRPHGPLYALAYGGGRFVVAGYRYDYGDPSEYNHPWIAYSTDGGKTWMPSTTTSEESQPHGELFALTYGGGRFVVAGYKHDYDDTSENLHPWIAYSTDGGETWTPSTTTSDESQPHGRLRALTYGGGRFVVAGYRFGAGTSDDPSNNYHPWIAYSTDGGETWTRSETTSEEDQPHGQLRALTYGGGRFVVAGFRYEDDNNSENFHPWIAYSTDGGETWEKNETTSEESQPRGQLYALTYGGGRFVVAGYRYGSSSDDDASENYHPWIAYSTDGGKTWTKNETTSVDEQPHGELHALTYAPDSYCWKFGQEEEAKEEESTV